MAISDVNVDINIKTRKTLSKSELLKGKLEELVIPNYPSEGDNSIVFLGPLTTRTALALFNKSVKSAKAVNQVNPIIDVTANNTNVDAGTDDVNIDAAIDLVSNELSEAISESLCDESGNRLLSVDEVPSLPLEIYPLIARAVMNKVNMSILRFNEVNPDDAGEVPLEKTNTGGSCIDSESN